MAISPDKLLLVRRQTRQASLGAACFVVVFGSLIYSLIAISMTVGRGIQLHHLLGEVDLRMSPTDGITVCGSLMAVVISVTLTLSSQPPPRGKRAKIRHAQWQMQIAFTGILAASAAVTTTLICWLSSERSHSWGSSISLTLLTLVTVAFASTVRASSKERLVEAQRRYESAVRRQAITQRARAFVGTHPLATRRKAQLLRSIFLTAFLALLAASITAMPAIGYANFTVACHQAWQLFLMSWPAEVILLAAGCRFWTVRILGWTADAVNQALVPALTFAALALLTGGPALYATGWMRLTFALWALCLFGLATGVLLTDARCNWFGTTVALRRFAVRPFLAELRDAEPKFGEAAQDCRTGQSVR